MTEWGVYLVVVSLVTTAILIGRPLVTLTRVNTKLECAVDRLNETMDMLKLRIERYQSDNRDSHNRLWQHNEKQDLEMKRHANVLERHQTEIDYLKKHGFEADFTKMEYSINKGLWGTSIGGKETLKSEQTLPESAYPSQLQAQGEEDLQITFTEGEITAVNGRAYTDKVAAIQEIERLASRYAIGRDMHIGDTIIGIKGRVGFEAAAPMVIINAHKMLEKHTLSKWQQYWKDQIGTWYGMFLHEAQYLEPVMRDMEAFLQHSQANVTGTVSVRMRPYGYTLVGVDSPFDLMKTDFGEYGEVNKAWTAQDAKGFTKITAVPTKIFYAVQKRNGK
jgi:argininosuccinate synthase